jgi:hypothetical protein
MPLYKPLIRPQPLPEVDSAVEHAVLDFKVRDAKTEFHRAKDVAAFANHLGGTLVIGAHESGGYLRAYPGVEPSEAAAICKSYSQSVEQRCEPHPIIETDIYECPGNTLKKIVVINVEPSLTLVGARIQSHKPDEGFGKHSFVFPLRTENDSTFLTPGQLPMYMIPQIRRVIILLSTIPAGTAVRLVRTAGNPGTEHIYAAVFDAVLESFNVVRLRGSQGSPPPALVIPLDVIVSVFHGNYGGDSQAMWTIVYRFF